MTDETFEFTTVAEYLTHYAEQIQPEFEDAEYTVTFDTEENADLIEVVVEDHFDARALSSVAGLINRAGGAMSTRENGGLEIVDEYEHDGTHHFFIGVNEVYQNAITVVNAANRRPEFHDANRVALVEKQDTAMVPFTVELTYDPYEDPTVTTDDRGGLDDGFWSLFSEWALQSTTIEGTRQEFVLTPPTDWFDDDPRENP